MDSGKIKRTTLRLSENTHKALRLVCALTSETQSKIMDRLIQAELRTLEKQRQAPIPEHIS